MILVALVVLLVPELLSGPRHAGPRSAPAAGEPPMLSYTVRLDQGSGNPAGPPGAPSRLAAAQPKAAPPPEKGPQQLAATAPQPDAGPQLTDKVPPADTVPKHTATAPQHQPAHQREVTPRREPAGPSERPARLAAAAPRAASAAAAPAKRPGTAAAAGAGWQVQVGSFDSREHAERLARELKVKGFAGSVSQSLSHGRRWYRVRVGPERDRTAALAVARRLHAAGQAAVIERP